jgi:hypothetical protein
VTKKAKPENEYEVESIIERRQQDGFVPEYRVRWKGYGEADDTWEPMSNLSAKIKVKAQAVRARPGRLSALRVSHRKLGLYGVFVWARRALNCRKRRFPARAVGAEGKDRRKEKKNG